MNKDFVLFHLREAADELSKAIAALECQPSFGEPELSVSMQHVYHHLNTSWNARATTASKAKTAVDREFNAWGRYPRDLPVMKV